MTTLSGCTACAPTAGPSDQQTRNFGCWWSREVLGLGGRPASGFGLGAATTDTNLSNAAMAVLNLNDPCNLTASGATVAAFQTAWNATTDTAMQQSTNSSNATNWPMTVDGKYGPNTSDAVAAALDTQSATGCTTYTGSYSAGGGGGAGYSAAVVAAATALDAYLTANGCTSCTAAGQPPSASDPLSALVFAFKTAILVTPGNTSTASPTVTGSTINMSTAACQQAYGPGSVSDLTAVLGVAKTSTVQCTDANCNCLAGGGGVTPPSPTPPSPGPSPSPTPPSPVTPPSTPSSSSSSSSGVVIALVAGAAVGGGLLYAKKKGMFRKHHG